MISAISPRTAAPPRSTEPVRDAARAPGSTPDPTCSRSRRTSPTGSARAMSHASRGARSSSAASCRAISIARAVARTVPPSLWIATMCAGLPARRAASARCCATTCSHPSAITSTAPTFGCPQYAASVSCVVVHVGAELAAAARYAAAPSRSARPRPRRAPRRPTNRSPSARRAGGCARRRGRPAGGSPGIRRARSCGRSRIPLVGRRLGEPRLVDRRLARATRSPRPRALSTLCVWTCAPGGISAVATPIGLPYLTTLAPSGIDLHRHFVAARNRLANGERHAGRR